MADATNTADEVIDLTSELLDDAVRLTHPDCHPPERQELAQRVTQGLLALKPFTFPAPSKPIAPAPEPAPRPRDTPATPTTQNQSYPCRTCKSTVPFFYCTPCRAEYEKREAEEDAKRKAKQPQINAAQRAWYAERKNRYATTKSCAACGKNFKPKRKDARFCSNACRQAMHRVKHARSAAS
jgi:hypothetical protein